MLLEGAPPRRRRVRRMRHQSSSATIIAPAPRPATRPMATTRRRRSASAASPAPGLSRPVICHRKVRRPREEAQHPEFGSEGGGRREGMRGRQKERIYDGLKKWRRERRYLRGHRGGKKNELTFRPFREERGEEEYGFLGWCAQPGKYLRLGIVKILPTTWY